MGETCLGFKQMLKYSTLAFLFPGAVAALHPQSSFGHGLREEFLLEEGYTNLNHGSYGSAPRFVLDAQRRVRKQTESNPDRFYRYEVYDLLNEVRAAVAAEIGANSSDDVAIIDNASEGMNALLKSLVKPGSNVLFLSDVEYFMVAETLRFLRDTENVTLLEVPIASLFPVANEDEFEDSLVALVEAVLSASLSPEGGGGGVGLCSFSHITSMPSLVLPIQRLAQACHDITGATVVIDGAHALGNLQANLDVTNTGADVYVSNGHKWFFTPKGACVLWVSPRFQPPMDQSEQPYLTPGQAVYPVVISNEGSAPTPFGKLFSWEGTKDYGAFLAFPAAMEWRESVGGSEAIVEYLHTLAAQGGDLLAEAWGTATLVPSGLSSAAEIASGPSSHKDGADSSSSSSSSSTDGSPGRLLSAMVTVELPTSNCTLAASLPELLLDQYNTWVPTVAFGDRCWTRVSAMVYNDLSDFQYLADAIKNLLITNEFVQGNLK